MIRKAIKGKKDLEIMWNLTKEIFHGIVDFRMQYSENDFNVLHLLIRGLKKGLKTALGLNRF